MLIHFSQPLPSVRQFIITKLTSNAMRSSDARGVGSAMYGTNHQRGIKAEANQTTQLHPGQPFSTERKKELP